VSDGPARPPDRAVRLPIAAGSGTLTESDVEAFQRDGAVVLRGLFTDWVEPLRRGMASVHAAPSALERSYRPRDGSAAFFQDFCRWPDVAEFRAYVHASPAAEIAAALMRSLSARFFHDHTLIKFAGNSTVTPWHQDEPYYCVRGEQSVSFWTPLDPVERATALRCVAGSHRWSAKGFRPARFDGTALYAEGGDFDTPPDIDADPAAYRIVSAALAPGDAIAFDFRTVHGAAGNTASIARRVFSARWVGDDARYVRRPGRTSPPFTQLTLADGEPLVAPEFPRVWPR
jgi:ectoine hydroxylase-related dioxygenase (phytanoyl-CoA dioxygenase family)